MTKSLTPFQCVAKTGTFFILETLITIKSGKELISKQILVIIILLIAYRGLHKMYQKFSFTSVSHSDVEILTLSGYLEELAGQQLKEFVEMKLEDGITEFGINFCAIKLINSPGVASLLDIGSSIVDDYAGNLVVWGFDSHNFSVMEMAGFFFVANQVENEAEGIEFLSK